MLIRHTVCRFLEERGFAVESATNPVEALALLATVLPSLIITDMQMPKMSGSEFITALKGNPHTATIPIVILAGQHVYAVIRANSQRYVFSFVIARAGYDAFITRNAIRIKEQDEAKAAYEKAKGEYRRILGESPE